MNEDRKAVLIIGLGNELLGDDGLGVHVARSLRAQGSSLPDDVEVLEAGRAIDGIIETMARFGRVILVDAISMSGEPGQVYRAEIDADWKERQTEPGVPLSLHQSAVFDALAMARLMRMLPARVTLIGAEPERIELSLELTPKLRRAAARIVSILVAETKVHAGEAVASHQTG